MTDKALEQAVELALTLSVEEQAKLLERVAAHLAHEIHDSAQDVSELDWTEDELNELFQSSKPKTGAEIAAMIKSGELNTGASSEMINPHIADSVQWVKALRHDMAKKRNLDWDSR